LYDNAVTRGQYLALSKACFCGLLEKMKIVNFCNSALQSWRRLQVVYVTAIVPYIVLVILFIWNIQLEGAWLGIHYYLVPDWQKLAEAKVSIV